MECNCFSPCSGGKKALGEHAAVWVPDAEANTCMHCHQLQVRFFFVFVANFCLVLDSILPSGFVLKNETR